MKARDTDKTRAKSTPRNTSADWTAVITHVAFMLALAAAATRCLMMETLRETFPIAPGPLGPGAATSIGLDLLCCVPALLVLIRRAVDETYVIRWNISHILLLPLALWMAASERWADDKFAAVVSTGNFVAALALLWAASQLVRSWLRLRLVAAITVGLLPVFLASGLYFKFVEGPDTIKAFEAKRIVMLQEHNLDPTSFAAKQFENKIVNSEVIGFNASTNSFAAMLILTATIAIGVIMQRRSDRDRPGWAIAIFLLLPLTAWLLAYTRSKAAIISPFLTAGLLVAVWHWRGTLAKKSREGFWYGVTIVILAMAAVIGHGIAHRSLPTASLNFRWRYWTAAWKMFKRHPIIGVGWDNFGPHYLRDRLENASEEIRDPHNFIIRFFLELGAVGGILLLAWLLRLWWELTRPTVPPVPASAARPPAVGNSTGRKAVAWVFAVAALCMGINVAAAIDFSQTNISWLELEVFKRIFYLIVMTAFATAVALRSLARPTLDDRPAPWILYSILVSVGVFLIHNLIEFSLFEPGPMCLVMLLVGSALGIRQTSVAGRRRRTPTALTALVLAMAAWVAALLGIFIPATEAEAAARAGDQALAQKHLDLAVANYQRAWFEMPLNADYAYRVGWILHAQAQGMAALNHEPKIPKSSYTQIVEYYDLAIQANPSAVLPYLQRARLALFSGDKKQMMADFRKALQLNPNEVSIRLNYARALESLQMPAETRDEFEAALKYDDMLDPGEPKRLPPEQVKSIRQEMDSLPISDP